MSASPGGRVAISDRKKDPYPQNQVLTSQGVSIRQRLQAFQKPFAFQTGKPARVQGGWKDPKIRGEWAKKKKKHRGRSRAFIIYIMVAKNTWFVPTGSFPTTTRAQMWHGQWHRYTALSTVGTKTYQYIHFLNISFFNISILSAISILTFLNCF